MTTHSGPNPATRRRPPPPHLDEAQGSLEDAGVFGGGDEGRRVGHGGWPWQHWPGTILQAQRQRGTCR